MYIYIVYTFIQSYPLENCHNRLAQQAEKKKEKMQLQLPDADTNADSDSTSLGQGIVVTTGGLSRL